MRYENKLRSIYNSLLDKYKKTEYIITDERLSATMAVISLANICEKYRKRIGRLKKQVQKLNKEKDDLLYNFNLIKEGMF